MIAIGVIRVTETGVVDVERGAADVADVADVAGEVLCVAGLDDVVVQAAVRLISVAAVAA
jgi:hypothetical protein